MHTKTNGNSNHPVEVVADDAASKVDVLIVGAGPAGVVMANWLSRFSARGIRTRIIDRRPNELKHGQASGLMARTLEMFEHLGVIADIDKESTMVSELRFWGPDHSKAGRLHRTNVMAQDSPGDSRFTIHILHQNRVEHYLNENTAKNSNGQVVIERGVFPESLVIDESLVEDHSAYPITVRLRHLVKEADYNGDSIDDAKSTIYRSIFLSPEEQEAIVRQGLRLGRSEVVSAKYVIGSDGAHSWVRRNFGIAMVGEHTNSVWGVIEGVPLTNFPDLRTRSAIHSAEHGAMMIVPQVDGTNRLYTQLPIQVEPGTYLDRSEITSERILETAQKILSPYTLDMKTIRWYTGYPIGQRLTESFSKSNRVFFAGDACHTHSPKAGQGMNVSMQDTYNLGWKLGLVLTGLAKPEILYTYSDERRMVANDLIKFDHMLSRLMHSKHVEDGEVTGDASPSVSPEELTRAFAHGNRFAAGMLIEYPESDLIRKDLSRPELAKHLHVGKRFVSVQVVNAASANAEQLVQKMQANGAFRVLVFAGKVAEPGPMARLRKFAAYLDGPKSIVSRYTPADQPRDSVIGVVTIHSSPRLDVELYDFPQPSIFSPRDHDKIFCAEPSYHRGDGKAYETFGIDKEEGAIIVVRPDNYVGLIVGLEDAEKLDVYFQNFLVPVAHPHDASKIELIYPPKFA